MVERQKPTTPSPDELWLEKKSESVKLVEKDEMLKRLRAIYKNHAHLELAERVLFPRLVQCAGRNFLISSVPAIIVEAVQAAQRNKNIRSEAGWYALLVDAMIDEPHAREKARAFLADAMNG